ncbi:uncharacterized protein LOC132567603 [Heteronotia binoei]|uniref:uncharacterized protein LOC132567603 n=1 Tax=Heteronotia binoei TaxID=13085 RepID=UPI00292F35CE|nr:uncharacterized protein LOC132567603 [Heteronotia binoei]
MDTLTASSVSSRPWVLQFFRNLFGSSRHVRLEGQGPKADAKEKESVQSELLDSPLPDTEARLSFKNTELDNTSFTEICEAVMDSHAEKLSGHLKEISLGDTISTAEKTFSTLLESTGLEMGDSDGFADSKINKLAHHPTEIVPASDEKKSHRGTLGMDEISQAPCADDEVSMAARSLAVTEDCSAEEERELLLKEDVRVEPPKTELSRWNRLINMYKQRRRLPATKVSHLQSIPAQPETEDEATVDLMIYGVATPKPQFILSDSSGTAYVCGFPGNESGDLAGHCETAQGGSNDAGSTLEHPKNIF